MKKKADALTLHAWWHAVGTANVAAVVRDLGTSLPYMRAITYRRHKRPGYDFALRIVAAAEKITPGFAPDLGLMMMPLAALPADRQRGGSLIPPSPAFLRAAKRIGAAA